MTGEIHKKKKTLLSVAVAASIILIMAVVSLLLIRSKQVQAYRSSALLIVQIENYLEVNRKREQSLIDSLKENYIAKAKAVAYIIDNMDEVENDLAELIKISKMMSIDEIHIFDDKGVICGGTIPAFYGYSFDSGEQLNYFSPMLADKSLSMCQDVMPNTAEGRSMMYAACWNETGRCIVQIGIEPRRLIEELQSYDLSELIEGIPTYDGVDIAVADKETGVLVASTKNRYLGRSLKGMGLNKVSISDGEIHSYKAQIDNRGYYCSLCEHKDNVIAVLMDRTEVNRGVPLALCMVFFYLMLSVLAIGLIVRHMKRLVIEEHTNANIDVMTGFLNRRAYETDMRMQENIEQPLDFAYFSVDLNGLKETNDLLGHIAGDELIVGAAQCMSECFGALGKLYRVGGDEFVAMIRLGRKSPDELLKKFKEATVLWSQKHKRTLSLSSGYADRETHDGKSLAELAKIADGRMYEAKAEYYSVSGKDRRRGLEERAGEKTGGLNE